MGGSRNTKTITVSFPVDLAEQAEQLARTESRTMSELFREAWRLEQSVRRAPEPAAWLTGDNDLLVVGSHQNIRILTALDYLELSA